MELREASKKLEVNYNEVIARFGGAESIYGRFLKKFLNDNTYCELEEAWKKNDYEEIERKAHTLKGVAGNLGLEKLFSLSNSLVQKIRNKEFGETPEIYTKLQECYKDTIIIINKID